MTNEPADPAMHFCDAQAVEWRGALEFYGFIVRMLAPRYTEQLAHVAITATKDAIRIEAGISVQKADRALETSYLAEVFISDKRVMTLRTPVLLQGSRFRQFVGRLQQLDQDTGRQTFGPAIWSSRLKAGPQPTGGVHLTRVRDDEMTATLLTSVIRATSVLYSIVASAQTAEPRPSAEENAQYEVSVATLALMAAELESFVQLVNLGLEGPGMVHARTVGDFATRIAIYRQNPEIAREIYESLPASLVELLGRFADDDRPEVVLGPGVPAQSMRLIERRPAYRRIRDDIAAGEHLLSLAEHESMSKRTHGDVTAMSQVALALAARGADIRSATGRAVLDVLDNESTVRSTLVRVLGYAIHAAVDVSNIVSVACRETLEELAQDLDLWRHRLNGSEG